MRAPSAPNSIKRAGIITNTVKLYSGSVIFKGEDISRFNARKMRDIYKNMQMIYQSPVASFDPEYTLGKSVAEALRNNKSDNLVSELFISVGLSAERIIKQLAGKSKEGFVSYLMQHSDLTFEQAESIFYFQIHGCLTINRLMLQNNCRDWHNVQQTIDRFIRAGLQEFLQDGE